MRWMGAKTGKKALKRLENLIKWNNYYIETDKNLKTNTIKMFTHIPSGVVFQNRKEAVKVMGQRRYRYALRNRQFNFPNWTEIPLSKQNKENTDKW